MKILVISLAGIGDTFFATPLIHELRAHFQDARIDAFVRWPGSKGLLNGNPHLTGVYQKDFLQAGGWESLRFLLELRRNAYDVSINTHPQSRVHYRTVARMIGANLRISHHYDGAAALDRFLVNRKIPQNYDLHSVENNLACLSLLGVEPCLPRHDYEIHLLPQDLEWAEAYLASQNLAGRKLLGIHVGSGATKNLALRRWPLAGYLDLIQQLSQAQPGLGIMLFGGPSEEKDNTWLVSQANPVKVFRPKTQDLRQAAALLKRCSLFLSVDTALMHLAAAMKVPGQIVIETPTWNKPIQPFNQPFILVKNPAVAGRNLDYYRYDGRGIRGTAEELVRCMSSVQVADVMRAIMEALSRNP